MEANVALDVVGLRILANSTPRRRHWMRWSCWFRLRQVGSVGVARSPSADVEAPNRLCEDVEGEVGTGGRAREMYLNGRLSTSMRLAQCGEHHHFRHRQGFFQPRRHSPRSLLPHVRSASTTMQNPSFVPAWETKNNYFLFRSWLGLKSFSSTEISMAKGRLRICPFQFSSSATYRQSRIAWLEHRRRRTCN